MQKLIDALKKEIALLEKWADESQKGGWSTNQVQPQLERAAELKILLYSVTPVINEDNFRNFLRANHLTALWDKWNTNPK